MLKKAKVSSSHTSCSLMRKPWLRPFELGAQLAHFRVAGHFHAAYFGHELGLLPAVEQLGADTQLLGRRLRAAALRGQT